MSDPADDFIELDEDLIGAVEPGWSIGERVDEYRALPLHMQQVWMREMVVANPAIAMQAMAPDAGPVERTEILTHYRQLKARHQAQELFNASVLQGSEPVSVTRLADVLARLEDGTEQRPEPSLGGLLYPGRVNAVYGTHTAGKTWLGLHLARLNQQSDGHTLVLDYEDTAAGFADRCRALDSDLATSISYVSPAGPLNVAQLRRTIEDNGVTLVILDSSGESLAASGLDSNVERDVTQWFRMVPDALAAFGPAVLLIDHIAKKQDGTPSPVGSFRKSAAITGAQFALENKIGFSRERAGWSRLTCTKDRNGHFATGEVVSRVDFTPHEDGLTVDMRRGESEAMAVTDRMENEILVYVQDRMRTVHGKLDENGDEMDGRPSITQIRSAVKGDNTRKRDAVDRLVRQGWLVQEHIASGKSTRDVYVPAPSDFQPIAESEI